MSRPADSRHYLVGPAPRGLAASDPYSDLKAYARPLLRRSCTRSLTKRSISAPFPEIVLYLDFIETTQALRFIVTPGRGDPGIARPLASRRRAAPNDPASSEQLLGEHLLFAVSHAQYGQEWGRPQRLVVKARQTGYAEKSRSPLPGFAALPPASPASGFPRPPSVHPLSRPSASRPSGKPPLLQTARAWTIV